jgi:hypothetical protein
MRTRSLLHRALAAAGVAAIGAGLLATPAYAANSKVYVVHGIPATPVDVWVNGAKTLENFQPKDVAGPLDLPEGSYDLALTAPGQPLASAILTVDDAAVPGGANISLVAHLKADGNPTITAFANDVSPVAAGEARLIVRHTAAAPAVDVRAGGTPVFSNLTNPNEAKGEVPAGTVSADVVAAGTSTVVLGPTDLTLNEGTATIVYAIGSLEQQSLDLVAQTLTGLHSAPGGVPTGDGGLADTGSSWWLYALVGGLALLLAGGALRVARTRR